MALEFVALKLAESVVSQAIERIGDLLINEASSLRGVSGDIKNLQTELKWIESFLRDADKKQEKDERVRLWISEVRDISCEIEDIIETYVYKVRSSYTKIAHLRKLRGQIRSIEAKLRGIGERRQRYQIEFLERDREPNVLQRQRRTYPDEEDDDDIITLTSTMAALKDQIMRNNNGDRDFGVVSIFGMGGLGKTTLAKKMYNDADVKKHFNCYAWVFVSQQCLAREVLTEILMQVGFRSGRGEKRRNSKEFVEERKSNREILKGLEEHELVALTKEELKEKRYLVVLDDIWSLDAWYSVRSAFPRGESGSRVVITTRIKEVALSEADPRSSPPIEPPLLTSPESWELLRRKAFPREVSGDNRCPPELEEMGKEMAAECGGLPLAIVVLGGLLRTKNSAAGWERVKRDVKSRMINKLRSEKQYRVEDILELSFQELPFYLKPCFLYLGSFPEDSEIRKRTLVRLWMAERFVLKNEAQGSSIEDIGEQYLDELIDRCMVQVDKYDHTGERVKSCRLHDLMRDLCLSKAKEELFLETKQQQEANTCPPSRRMAVHGSQVSAKQAHPHLRSLLCFSIHELSGDYASMRNFRLVRVLHLDFLAEAKLPYNVGNLIHLRYLRVSGKWDRNFDLLHSIGNLRNLQTLDISGIHAPDTLLLPKTLWKLKNLRHLLLPYYYSLPFWSLNRFFGDNPQVKLETLKGIYAKDLIKRNLVIPMTNIKVLGINDLSSGKEVSLVLKSLSSNSQLGRLRSLAMTLSWEERLTPKFPKMELLLQCHDLTKLHLAGSLPNENLSLLPKNLMKLTLRESDLNQGKITTLEKLNNLRVLKLGADWLEETNRVWIFSAGGFRKLERLILDQIYIVGTWDIEEGAMPNLKRLDITKMLKLQAIPEGMKYVTTLRELNIKGMKKKFEDRIRRVNGDGIEGSDFYKVSHIPSITFAETLL